MVLPFLQRGKAFSECATQRALYPCIRLHSETLTHHIEAMDALEHCSDAQLQSLAYLEDVGLAQAGDALSTKSVLTRKQTDLQWTLVADGTRLLPIFQHNSG